MAILIPSFGSCASRMTGGEKRLATRLEQKLEDDYLLWYDVPVGPRQSYPDFVLLHPRRGLLILEVKDWKLDIIRRATRQVWEITPGGQLVVKINPLAQARHCAIQVVNALERDARLVQGAGRHEGKLAFPWGHGVVLANITRKQFEDHGLDQTIEANYVICKDEMTESVDAEAFQKRLWDMFPHTFGGTLTPEQLDRVRWIMFPEVRVQTQGALFDDSDADAELPDIMRVMDLQQEQLARSLGDGHRVIHGVAGSGKTMILGYRAEYLARAQTPASKPILLLCYNEPLAVKLHAVMHAKGLAGQVQVRHFHRWCRDLLKAHGLLPTQRMPTDQLMAEYVQRVRQGVEGGQIPSGQYQAILIDEGHDFAPEWLRLATQMVDPATSSLLLLYDDAQSIYERSRSQQFSFKSLGVQAQGRTTILKLNYRNTRQILHLANQIAGDLLTADDKDDDGIPLLKPVSCGRDGPEPIVLRLPSLHDEAREIAELLSNAHQEGHAWNDMAVLCRTHALMDVCADALQHRQLPYEVRRRSGDFKPHADTIKVMTLHACKGLEFAVVAIPGMGTIAGEDEKEEARLIYVGTTRATQKLIFTIN